MRWLVGPLIASFVGAFIIVRIFDYLTASAKGGAVEVGRAGLFVATWSAITASAGMAGLDSRARRLRKSGLGAFTKGERR